MDKRERLLEERLSTIELLKSEEWLQYQKVMKEYKISLMMKMRDFVRRKMWTEAYGALSKWDCVDKQIKLMYEKQKELEEEQ